MLQGPTSPPMETSESESAGGSLEHREAIRGPRLWAWQWKINTFIKLQFLWDPESWEINVLTVGCLFWMQGSCTSSQPIGTLSQATAGRKVEPGLFASQMSGSGSVLQDICPVKVCKPTHRMENFPNQRSSFLICATQAHRKHFFQRQYGSSTWKFVKKKQKNFCLLSRGVKISQLAAAAHGYITDFPS